MNSRLGSLPLKLGSFYGNHIARPYVLMDKDGEPVKKEERVDAPMVNEALIEWAQKVPVKQGGVLVKPEWSGETELPKEPRNDFQIFFQERYDDVLAANPALFAHGAPDRRTALSAASVYWRETLTEEERQKYRERAAEEKKAAAAALAEAEQKDPKFKAFRQKLATYKESMRNMVSAAKASTGPLWRMQRRMNAKYRLLQAQEEEMEQGEDAEEGGAAGASRGNSRKAGAAAAQKKAGPQKKKKATAAARKRLVDSDSDGSSSEEEEREWSDEDAEVAAAEAAAAAEAMQKLLLATAKKQRGKAAKKSPAKKAAGGSARKAAPASRRAEEDAVVSSGEEEEEQAAAQQQQQAGGRRSRSGAAALAAALGSKGRQGMYADEFELPPSQSATPAKGGAAKGKAAKGAAAAKVSAAAQQPVASPGKRTRTSRHSAVAAAAEPVADESPAKKQRHASSRRG